MNKKVILLIILSLLIMLPTIDIISYRAGKEPIFSQFYYGCSCPPKKTNGFSIRECDCAQASYYDFFYYRIEANEEIYVSPSNYQLRLLGFILL
jgi:hypothetical protein